MHKAIKMPEGFYMSICRDGTTNCQGGGDGSDGRDDDGALAVGLTEVALARMARHVTEHPTKGIALEIGAIAVADEEEVHVTLFQHDLLDTQLLAIHAEGHHTDEFFGNSGDLAKTVSEARAIGLQRGFQIVTVGQIVEFAIEQHALGVAGDILLGEVHLNIGFEGAVFYELRIKN